VKLRSDAAQRLRDLIAVIEDRGGRLADNANGRRLLGIVLDHALLIGRDAARELSRRLLPELHDAELRTMLARNARYWGATELAAAIDFNDRDRKRLGITTIITADGLARLLEWRRRQSATINRQGGANV
jgi:hypothetical protein